MSTGRYIAATLLGWILSFESLLIAQDPPRILRPHITGEAVKLDGVLEEVAWKQAEIASSFLERFPIEGKVPSEQTRVRVLLSESFLYIGVECLDSSPDKIIAKEKRRDAPLDEEDHFTVVLDTYRDKRNGYLFQTNPLAARYDALVTGPESTNKDWDGVWDVATHVGDNGWSIEYAIPLKSLRFKAGNSDWGINFRRIIKRDNEENLWAAHEQNLGLLRLAHAGLLRGMEKVKVQAVRVLDFKPYFVAGIRQDATRPQDRAENLTDGGLDVRYGITSSVVADLTLNTDFAQTEVDEQRVNLTRFPLFFPEKRDFFLENAGVFEFATRSALPFFSRRIGLSSGREIPILGGVRLTGKMDRFNFGLLSVQTGSQYEVPAQNSSVVRLKREFFSQSHAGVIYTRVSRPDGFSDNSVFGFDFNLQTSKFRGNNNFEISAWAQRSFDGDRRGQWSAGGRIDYPNDRWDVVYRYAQIGANFNPDLGFVPRRDIRSHYQNTRFSPRINRHGIRRLNFEFEADVITDFHNRLQNRELRWVVGNLSMDSGEKVEYGIKWLFEKFPEDFEISDGVVIRPGKYQWQRQYVEFGTANKRKVSVGGEYEWGGFVGGRLKEFTLDGTYRFSETFSTYLSYERNSAVLPVGSFTTNLVRARLNASLTPNFSIRALLQYDTESGIGGLNFRVNYIFTPGREIFLIYNQANGPLEGHDFAFRSREAIFKISYLFRF